MAVTDSRLPYGSIIGSTSKQNKDLLSHILNLQSLFHCKAKGVKNAGDKIGLNLDNLLYFFEKCSKYKYALKIQSLST